MLAFPGVVVNVADSHRVSPSDPFLTEFLPSSDAVNKIGANFASQLGHHLFCTFSFSDAIDCLVLTIQIMLALQERSILDPLFLAAFLLSLLPPLHGESLLMFSNSI